MVRKNRVFAIFLFLFSLLSACSTEASDAELNSMEARAEEWSLICEAEQQKVAQISKLQSDILYPAKDTSAYSRMDSVKRLQKQIFIHTCQSSLQKVQFDLLQMRGIQQEASAWLRGARKMRPSEKQLRMHWDAWQRRFFVQHQAEQNSRASLLALLPVELPR